METVVPSPKATIHSFDAARLLSNAAGDALTSDCARSNAESRSQPHSLYSKWKKYLLCCEPLLLSPPTSKIELALSPSRYANTTAHISNLCIHKFSDKMRVCLIQLETSNKANGSPFKTVVGLVVFLL